MEKSTHAGRAATAATGMIKYQHGGDIYRNHADMDFSANINPLGLPSGVRRALMEAVETCDRYPDSGSGRLTAALSEFHGISPETVLCGNGAADLLFQLAAALRPKRAVLLAPSFLEYEQALKAVGSEILWYDLSPADGFHLQAEGLCRFLGERSGIDLIVLCNPNNPTGFALRRQDMEEILELCRRRGIFCLVDECFNEFLDDPAAYTVLDLAASHDRLFVLKAFTKLYAMAGIRLGYGVCRESAVLDRMQAVRQPWSVSSLAQAAGEAALAQREYVQETRTLIRRERAYMKEQLTRLGFQVYASMANYLFFQAYEELYEECLELKVLIRSCANYRGLDGTYYRICLKKREDNDRLLSVLRDLLSGREAPFSRLL